MIYRKLPLVLTSALVILGLQACSTPQAQKSPEEVALSYLKALESKDIEAVTELTHIESQFRQAVPELTEQLSQSFEKQGGIKKITIEGISSNGTEANDESNSITKDSTYAKIHLDIEYENEKPLEPIDPNAIDRTSQLMYRVSLRNREWIELEKYNKGWKVKTLQL